MKIRTLLIAAIAAPMLMFATPASAKGGDVLKELTPPPRMLLKHQDELGLTDKQKEQLKTIVKNAQNASLDLEFKLEEESAKLAKLLQAKSINLDAALKQADVVMATESKLKRVRLEMLVRTKMLLTQDQLAKIEAFKKQRREDRKERRQGPAAKERRMKKQTQ